MKQTTCRSMLVAALALMPVTTMAQVDIEGRQYASLSAFSWDGGLSRTTASAQIDNANTVRGYFADLAGDGSALGARLVMGYQVGEWLGVELHVAGGGSEKVKLDGSRTDFVVVFPDDFDFGQFAGLTSDQIAALDPTQFEGVEVEATESAQSVDGKVKLNQAWGLFLRPSFTFAERFTVYGLAGMSYVKMDAKGPGIQFTKSNTGLAYGAGMEFGILPGKLNATLDFVQYADEDSASLEATTVGVRINY